MTLDKTFEPAAIESRHYEEWEKSGIFAAHPEGNGVPHTIMMPPPNVTGSLHMGHALNMSLQDILTRYYRMKGRDALWMPGTDHAGIATQMVVERQLAEQGIKRTDLGRKKFLEKVWEWKGVSGGTITTQLRKLGTTPDWPRERFTMDDGCNKAVLKVFTQLFREGLIYKDKRLVNWDPKLHTAVSDLEVEHKEVKGKLYHVRYPLEDGSDSIKIATTRPETILADGAIAVHPDDERYKHLVGKFAVVPVCNRIIPIIADEYVEPEFGSGAVKITAAHDFNDFQVYKRHKEKGIPLINLMTIDGKMNENCPEGYVGLDRFDARKKIVADLEELEYLEKVEDHVHKVPYGDRSGVVLEPYLTDQWYVDAATLAKPAIEAVETGKTKFVPQQWENTYFAWMRAIEPWCISRQLWWGHQIPAWYDKDGKIYVAETEEEAQQQAGAGIKLTRDPDVLDTWFSSALWPFSTLGWPEKTPELNKYYPGDVLVTGFDIIFFWVARMMMMGCHFMGDVPFKTVYIHALVRDAKGQKMSKSKGNVIDPLDLTQKYGADAVRFTLCAMAAQGRDIRLSEQRVEGYRNFATKIWNAARYLEMNNCKPDAAFKPEGVSHVLNQWIVGETAKACAGIDKALAEYKFNDAANTIYDFVWGTFCDWYLELTKPLLDTDHAPEIKSTAAWVFDQILLMLNPFMPFISEELFAGITARKERLLASKWPEYPASFANAEAEKEIALVQSVISEIRSVRNDMNIPASAKLHLQIRGVGAAEKAALTAHDPLVKRMARLESVTLSDDAAPKGAIQSVVGNLTLVLPVADIIDISKEKTRLQKEIEKQTAELKRVEAKLGNEQFVANAPEEIIAEQNARKAEASAAIAKLSAALKAIGEAA
ncbi:MAG: valine--tRNA ligase [Proteobacteria bacterium]|nr:valine--tRNA ligase [Pseudomonadota bacterium]